MNRLTLVVVFVTLPLVHILATPGCSDEESSATGVADSSSVADTGGETSPDPASDADRDTDTAADAAPDTAADTAPDTAADAAPDTAADTAAYLDAPADLAPDTADDLATDTSVDVPADTEADETSDTAVDVTTEVDPDTDGDASTDGETDAGSELYIALGTLGGTESAAFGVNNLGHVVGWARTAGDTSRHAFVWIDGTLTDLGLLEGDEESTARAINDSGLIVGTSESNVGPGSGDYRPFVVQAGIMTELPGLGGAGGWAADVNASGTICGYAYDSASKEHAVIWVGSEVTNIATGSSVDRQRGYGINAAGDVVGWEYQTLSGNPNDAFLYSDSVWSVIGGQDSPWQNAEAYAVNDSRIVVGLSAFPTGAWRAAMWSPNVTGARDLGNLDGFDYAELYAVNNAGRAVGRAYVDYPPSSHAILWDGEELVDLNSLMPEDFAGVLFEARDINGSDQVVGTALEDGMFRAFVINLP